MTLRDVSQTTESRRRAARWIGEIRAEAAAEGDTPDQPTEALFVHLMACSDCLLREHNDPDFCATADKILDGPDLEDDEDEDEAP